MPYFCPARDCPGEHQSKRELCPDGVFDTPPPEAQTAPREPPEFFRGARISKSRKQQSGNS